MKSFGLILILLCAFQLCMNAQQKERPSASVFIDSVSVKRFMDNMKGHKPNYVMVFGASKKDWITKEDVAYLITLVNSGEKCKCVQNAFSSYMIPAKEYSTVGGVAMDIIDAYRLGNSYPDEMWKCTKTDKKRAKEIEGWWKGQTE